jgi:hypothetical protein
MTILRVGMKVVCINDDIQCPAGCVLLSGFSSVTKGVVYTVRAVGFGAVTRVAIIRLVEIPDQWVDVLVSGQMKRGDVVFEAAAFRPVVDRKTDISSLTALLNTSKSPVLA